MMPITFRLFTHYIKLVVKSFLQFFPFFFVWFGSVWFLFWMVPVHWHCAIFKVWLPNHYKIHFYFQSFLPRVLMYWMQSNGFLLNPISLKVIVVVLFFFFFLVFPFLLCFNNPRLPEIEPSICTKFQVCNNRKRENNNPEPHEKWPIFNRHFPPITIISIIIILLLPLRFSLFTNCGLQFQYT